MRSRVLSSLLSRTSSIPRSKLIVFLRERIGDDWQRKCISCTVLLFLYYIRVFLDRTANGLCVRSDAETASAAN